MFGYTYKYTYKHTGMKHSIWCTVADHMHVLSPRPIASAAANGKRAPEEVYEGISQA